MSEPEVLEAEVRRARRTLGRPGSRLVEEGRGYAVRTSGDRRRRPACTVGRDAFMTLAREGVLKPVGEGLWVLAGTASRAGHDDAERAGRPGMTFGERDVAEPDGSVVRRRANLTESPLAWLARRGGVGGTPFLSAVEAAAGERLRDDFHRAGRIGRLTMDWSAGPRDHTPRGPGAPPSEHARAAKDRLHAALEAAGPGLREMLERVCLAEASLEAAERAIGCPKRGGKMLVKLGLQRVAAFYGIG